ncbi:MAG: pyruvate dehydrogenase (acetyl-transferring), homodimeric type [Burkholderiales bacterium]|jgi:pyruvate dehydrogenase E1 component|nr:pyruvate dehydrogenase (acetyl-transferring), homodimeric type [Burkholderiales bacterium]
MTDTSNQKQMNVSAFWRVLPQDLDPIETQEWIDAFNQLTAIEGGERATFLLMKLLEQARRLRVPMPPVLNTPYSNTISLADQPLFPGNLDTEAKLSAIIRWNALAMVVRANRVNSDLGGHIATYTSSADLFEVGFNHFFKAGQDGDCVYFQPHSAPGVYARAFVEGRLSEENIANYRQETGGVGLSSYCHPWLMPDFWQFPTGSMGLGAITAIYQARFMRYLENREIHSNSDRKVWCFVGDGEMDEPESIAGLSMASREGLDNLVFVVNCNLQRLDGPVRGNSSIVQELEGLFAGVGWNVVKVMWGSDWDPLFALDHDNVIIKRLHETVDGEFQKYAATDGQFNRETFFNKYPELQKLVSHLSDEDIDRLERGGHDPIKIYAAYHAAANHKGRPTVILAQTKKGYGMGHWGQGKMTSHQQKKLENDALLAFRDRFSIPLSDEDVENLRFYIPEAKSPEMKYLHGQREKLGGYLPARVRYAKPITAPILEEFTKLTGGTGERAQSSTMVFVQMLSQLLKNKEFGNRVVPIVADEARTFGMQSLFRQVAIYSPFGQLYDPEDRDELLYYKEAKNGQILEEGITEAGAISSWIAAATSYSTHGTTMLPFYIFYSCFGFQRIGDLVWAAGDSRARGFLIGATAGRTTLSGEGLQHEDGSSHLLFSTVPNCVAYDPTYGYEVVTIIQDGMRRMLEEQDDVFYYVTVMNENYPHPAMPENVSEGIIKGMYRIKEGAESKGAHAQLLGSGTILREVLAASELLQDDWKVSTDVWSVTSFTELRRDGLSIDRENMYNPEVAEKNTWVAQCLDATNGPVIATTDYMRSVPDLIRTWVPRRYITLGTDGYGRSDTRKALRDFYEVDRFHITLATLKALVADGAIEKKILAKAIQKYGLEANRPNPWDI